MDKLSEDLRQIQECEKNILREFIRICEKYEIAYFLVEGSLLGAIRHKGMIPWDDDIDIAMMREDYEKFLKVAAKELKPPYQCNDFRTNPDYIDYITQIVDTSVTVESSFRTGKNKTNVWIDVFVIDGMPKSKIFHKIHKFRLLMNKMLLMWSDLDHYVVVRERPIYEKFLIWLGKVLHSNIWLDTKKRLRKMDMAMKKYSPFKEGNTINFMSEYKWKNEFPLDIYGKGRKAGFEGFFVNIPEKSEVILKAVYGNYMELPKEEDRYKHKLNLLK